MKTLEGTQVTAKIERPDAPGAVCRINVASDEVERAFGRRGRVAVAATFENGYTLRSSLMPRGGVHILPLSFEARTAAAVSEGDRITVTLREDREVRTVDIPGDLGAALDAARMRPVFEAMSLSHRKEWTRAVEDAKRPETRTKRIAECITAMRKR
jgi:hypothetical protein